MGVLYHFSEDPTIERFAPHVPATNPSQPPYVWAIDEAHAPLYWFPRDCPRVTAWPRTEEERDGFEAAFTTAAARVHAAESAWLARIRTVELYRYDLPAAPFEAFPDAAGHWVSTEIVEPRAVTAVGDLLARHAAEGIDLRFVPSLWPLHDLAVSDRWEFSIVRMRNAQPRAWPRH